jgi:hypothetical protein
MLSFFDKNHVKLKTTEWEKIKNEYNHLVKEVKRLQAKVGGEEETSEIPFCYDLEELNRTVRKQSEYIQALDRFKNNDALIYEHEQYAKKNVKRIKELETIVSRLENENEQLRNSVIREKGIADLLANKLAKFTENACPQYRTVSSREFYA